MFCLHFRKNLWVSMEKRASKVSLRKIRGWRKPRAPRRAKRRKRGKTRAKQAKHGSCTQEPTRPAGQRYGTARPCWCGTTVPRGTAVPSGAARVCRFRDFRLFICVFPSLFGGSLLNLFESVFRLELGLGIRIVRLD